MGISGIGDKHGQATKQGKWDDALRPSPGLTCLTFINVWSGLGKKMWENCNTIWWWFLYVFVAPNHLGWLGNNGDGLTNDRLTMLEVSLENPIRSDRLKMFTQQYYWFSHQGCGFGKDLPQGGRHGRHGWVIPVIPSVIISSALFMIFMGAQNESLSNTFHLSFLKVFKGCPVPAMIYMWHLLWVGHDWNQWQPQLEIAPI
jgi:hypothetical protein